MLNDPAFQAEFTKGIVTLMMECVAPLQKEIEILKARPQAEPVDYDRLSATVVRPMVENMLLEEIAKFSVKDGADGKDGKDGKDAQPVDVDDIVSRVIALVPTPKDGAAGRDGQDGKDGLPGQDGATGKDGSNGAAGKDADIADVAALIMQSIKLPEDGKDGAPGKDGVGIAGTVIDRDGNLVITKTDGTIHSAGIVVGRDGERGVAGQDGAPGRDGFGFDDMEAIEDGLRFGHRFVRGKDIKEFWWNKPTLADFDHEMWKSGLTYPRGACVTYGGSLFICKSKQPTSEKPGLSKDWRCAVKGGRNGENGAMGPVGPKGDPGKDGRMVGFDGRAL